MSEGSPFRVLIVDDHMVVRGGLATFLNDRGGYDPFLLAQDVPTNIRVAEVTVSGNRAQVKVYTTFFAHGLDVSLEQTEGRWLISGVISASEAPTGENPEEMVEWFYTNYLNYPGNPLVSRAFLTRVAMTADFVEKVNEILDSFERGGYDPILLAQDVPESVTVGVAEIEGDHATVPVTTSFEGHALVVRLEQEDGVWKIADIEPAR
jgi:CheY-like chemotaxis protein